jgi:seryl-tRNA synthetase
MTKWRGQWEKENEPKIANLIKQHTNATSELQEKRIEMDSMKLQLAQVAQSSEEKKKSLEDEINKMKSNLEKSHEKLNKIVDGMTKLRKMRGDYLEKSVHEHNYLKIPFVQRYPKSEAAFGKFTEQKVNNQQMI